MPVNNEPSTSRQVRVGQLTTLDIALLFRVCATSFLFCAHCTLMQFVERASVHSKFYRRVPCHCAAVSSFGAFVLFFLHALRTPLHLRMTWNAHGLSYCQTECSENVLRQGPCHKWRRAPPDLDG